MNSLARIRSLLLAALLPIVLVSVTCSAHDKPKALPPQTMAPTPPDMGEEPITNAGESLEPLPEATLPPQIDVVEETPTSATRPAATSDDDGITVVLEPGTEEQQRPRSLFEASQAEKERRSEASESTIHLTNKNLKEYSKGGQLTFVEDAETEDDGEAAETVEGGITDPLPGDADEQFWRDRVLEIRLDWREALDEIGELESEIARLRTEFYAEDDPFYRDSQIKPAWDQALDDLDEARRTAERSQRELDVAMEEGRRAGALPGWLREGVELEPTPEEIEEIMPEEDDGFHEPSEPVILDEDDGG